MSLKRKLCAVFTTLGILLSFASCAKTSIALTAGGEDVPAGVYLGYLIQAYNEASTKITDTKTDMLKQKIDNKAAPQWITDKAIKLSTEHVAISKLFDELKLSFTTDEEKTFETNFATWWAQYGFIYEPNGAGKASVKKIQQIYQKKDKIFKHYYDTNGIEAVKEEDIKTYFKENYGLFKSIQFSFTDSNGTALTQEQKDALKKKAEGYLERAKKGEDMDTLIAAYAAEVANPTSSGSSGTSSAAASSATSSGTSSSATSTQTSSEATTTSASTSATSSATSSASTSSDATSSSIAEEETDPNESIIKKDTSEKPDKTNEAMFALKVGTPELIVTDSAYLVVMRYDIMADTKHYDNYRDTVLYDIKGDAFDELISEKAKKLTIVENKAAIKRYKPKNIVIDYSSMYGSY